MLSALAVPVVLGMPLRTRSMPGPGAGPRSDRLCRARPWCCCRPATQLDSPPDGVTQAAANVGAQVPVSAACVCAGGYSMFGMGYIGYMTFVVALLREQGQSAASITAFYALLGIAVMLSPRLWARLLDRYQDGRPLALLNALLGFATLLPALSGAWPWVLLSGLLFGAVFCRWWRRPRPWYGTTCRPRSGPAVSVSSPLSLRRDRSSARRWSAGFPMAPAASHGASWCRR